MSMSKHLLLAAAVLATLLVSATSEDFALYKLSLQWPATTCNFEDCRTPIPDVFTIHGLWPHYADDTRVLPYTDNPNCIKTPPYPIPGNVIIPLLQGIEKELNLLWPSVTRRRSNRSFWRHEWEFHGMCSDYPDQPKKYFEAALNLANNYKPLNVLGIKPGDQATAGTVVRNIKDRLGKNPQIACKPGTPRQLWEVRFCFDRAIPPKLPTTLRDCPKTLAGTCKRNDDPIIFPAAPVPDELNIIRQVVSV